MRKALTLLCLVALALGVLPPAAAAAPAETFRVYIFTGGGNPSAQNGVVQAIRAYGQQNGFGVQSNGDPATFNAEDLSRFAAVVFLNTGAGDLLSADQQAAFEAYHQAGGGFVGVGRAIETEPDWQFLTDLIGTRAASSADAGTATVKVADRVHPAGAGVSEYWIEANTFYNFGSNLRGLRHVLATVVESAFALQPHGATLPAIAGGTMGFDHPVAWCADIRGGRSFYTNAASSTSADSVAHLAGAIVWASDGPGDCGATIASNYQMTVLAAPPNVGEPIGFDVLPDGRVIQTTRGTGRIADCAGPPITCDNQLASILLHSPDGTQHQTLGQIRVYNNSEDGLYGPALDPNFATNRWVYLYYSPPLSTPPGNAPTFSFTATTWDPWIGYFQLSRFKFVDGPTPSLDMASEQQILRVPVNRGACCHVAGDIDFDKDGNLWLVTGDDTGAGSGNSGGFGPFNDLLTTESQQVAVANATGGTYTLTFNGQTTAPLPFNADAAMVEAALEALSNIDDVAVTAQGNNRFVQFRGTLYQINVPLMTATSSLTGPGPNPATVTVSVANGNNFNSVDGGQFVAPHVDARRSSLNTNDLRGKLLRFKVADNIAPAQFNTLGGAYTVPAGNLFAAGTALTRPEIYAMGFRNPFRVQVDSNNVAYVTDYSPDSNFPVNFRGPGGTGRMEIVRRPTNYGWPVCYSPNLPYYEWNFNTSQPLNPASPQTFSCGGATQGPPNTSRWNTGLTATPPVAQPDVWYSYRDNPTANPNQAPLGTPCFAGYNGTDPTPDVPPTPCPRLFPELGSGGVGPHGADKYEFSASLSAPGKFPAYWNNAIMYGEFTRDMLREIRLDSQNRIFKIHRTFSCPGETGGATIPGCDTPMDMQFGDHDGNFYLLTYGDGFFQINNDARMVKFSYNPQPLP